MLPAQRTTDPIRMALQRMRNSMRIRRVRRRLAGCLSLLLLLLLLLFSHGDARAQCEDATLDSDGDGLTDCMEIELGTDPNVVDTDNDGMPDGFEVIHGFDPTGRSESGLDADGDALTNLEEFLLNSDPRDPNSPAPTYFVSPSGSDSVAGGDESRPLRTIDFAQSLITGSGATAARIVLAEGRYTESLILRRGVTITGRPGQRPTIVGRQTGANDATLARLELLTETGGVVLLSLPNTATTVRDVYFTDTSSAGGTTGIRASGPNAADAIIEDCDFTGLMTGVEIVGGVPIIRRSMFVDQRYAGIHVLNTAVLEPGVGLSTSIDSARGFNTILYRSDIPDPVDLPLGIVSDTPELLLCENIDWSTDDFDEIRTLFQGNCDWQPILAKGSAILAATLVCTVWAAADQESLSNATMSLLGSGFAPLKGGVDGVYTFPSVPAGEYKLVCVVDGYEVESLDLGIAPGEIKSITIPMALKSSSTNGGDGCSMETGMEPAAKRGNVAAYAFLVFAFGFSRCRGGGARPAQGLPR
ncbi:MAG: hypothetical protein KF886_23805 [Candidatus Hydrogenedentes bacterium]|nr:hypothetical protein [Candidatus Hydrogenedentota bacterium]